jgi:hypothetical protein
MSHLEDRLAEFVFEELSEPRMEQARRHVAQCLECQGLVSGFQRVRRSLEQVRDLDVPRRMVFVESEAPARRSWLPAGWLVPIGVAAVLLLAFLFVVPIEMDWRNGGVTVAFGNIPAPEAAPQPAPIQQATLEPEPIDYTRLALEVEALDRAWLEVELNTRLDALDTAYQREIRTVRGEMDYLIRLQEVVTRDTLENSTNIFLLAERSQ